MEKSPRVTAKQLKEIAANLHELAVMLEANKNNQCLQKATFKTKKVKDRLDLDIVLKLSLVEAGDIKEAGEILEKSK